MHMVVKKWCSDSLLDVYCIRCKTEGVCGTRQGCIRFKLAVQTSAKYMVCIWCKVWLQNGTQVYSVHMVEGGWCEPCWCKVLVRNKIAMVHSARRRSEVVADTRASCLVLINAVHLSQGWHAHNIIRYPRKLGILASIPFNIHYIFHTCGKLLRAGARTHHSCNLVIRHLPDHDLGILGPPFFRPDLVHGVE